MKRLYLLLLGVFVLFISLTSVSYAYTLDDLFDYSDQLYNTTGIYTNVKKGCKVILDYETQIRNIYNNNNINASSFVVIFTDYGYGMTSVSLNFSDSPDVTMSIASASSSVNWINYTNIWKKWISLSNNGSGTYSLTYNSTGTNINNGGSTYSNTYGLVTSSYTGPFYNYNLQNNFIPPYTGPEFTVSTFNTSTIPIFANGQTENFKKLQFTTQMRLKDLGYISNFSEVYAIKGYFGPYVTDDIIDGSQAEFYYNRFGGTQNGSLVFYQDTGLVQIRTSKLIPKQGYNLNLAYQTEKNGEWTDFADVNFYALYYGDLSSSGDLVSPDLNSTVDVGFVRALDEFFNPTSGEISEASESIFQDPFGSGEFFGITYTDYDDWGFGDFVIGLFEGIYNIFNDFTDVSISFGMLRYNFIRIIYYYWFCS